MTYFTYAAHFGWFIRQFITDRHNSQTTIVIIRCILSFLFIGQEPVYDLQITAYK